jgi:hypothetical protein
MSESLAAYEFVHTLVEREGIECHFERRGRFIGANTPTHFVEFQKKADDLNRVPPDRRPTASEG